MLRETIAALEADLAAKVEPVAYRYKFTADLQWQYTENKEHAHRLAIVEPVYATPQQAVPAGFVLVPIEPTEEMLDAAYNGRYSGGMSAMYSNMIAAAPKDAS